MSEILGALFKYLVALLGASAVVAVFYLTLSQSKTQSAISDLVQLQTNIQQLYSGQPSFNGLNVAVAVAAGIVPSTMINNAGAAPVLFNPWGGAVTIALPANNNTFTLSSTLVPQEACTKLTMALGAAGTNIVLVSITPEAGAEVFPALPLTPAGVTAGCTAPSNTVAVTYRR